ncbi:transglycosylase SLT domain-containing protein [Nocardia ignorata]|uniref:SLT domain-containing protein n=1 Tax=Nocardia ignorata TaxID=145285 RepID=A0A4R6NYB0_NOCIG|nr:transglycosylase SLT domain-containing protein [Nocardia ignorata]TDP29756.1 SLT domain-containing protein [Nocardia ignorata]
MATFGAYNAGSARIYLRPALASNFRASVKALLKPIDESLNVTLKPVLAKGFNADVKTKAKDAAEKAGAKIEFGYKLAPRFRTELKAAAKTEAREAGTKILFSPDLAKGFRTTLRGKVNEAAAGVEATVTLRLSEAGLRQKIRGLKSTLPEAELRMKLDLSEAVRQIEDFRIAVAASPLSMNVNVDTTAAVAQLMALRSLAASVGDDVGAIGANGAARNALRGRRGGIFSQTVRAIRLQVEVDRASVARAEAELANVLARLENARRQQGDTLDRLNLAEQRHAEVLANSNASASQRIASEQRLARARRDHADATGRLSSLMNQEADAHDRVDRARNRQGSIGSALGAGLSAFNAASDLAIRNLFSFTNLVGVAKVALIALAAVSLVPLLGQLTQAAGVVALLPAAFAGFASVIATIVVGTRGITDAFKAAEKAREGAAKQAEAQAKAVASAQKQATAAARGVASAERGVASAERGVQSAQKASATAQKALTKAREDATKELEDLNRQLGRTSLNEEGAAIAVAEAWEAMQETFKDSDASATDRRRAVYNYNQALADQQDTLRESRELQQQVNEANVKGVEGSDQVVAAQERVAEAAQAETDANQTLTDAHQSLTDAKSQLAEAQQAVVEALNDGGDAADEFARKMASLSPAARALVQTMLDLKPALGELRSFVQEKLLDKMGDSIGSLVRKWIPDLKTGLGGIATEINGGLRRAFADLETESSRSKFARIFENTRKSIGPLLDGINDLLQAMLSLAGVGSDFMPSGAERFANLMKDFREWAESEEGQNKFKGFLRESLDTFNEIWEIVKQIGGVINSLFRGSDETGESWLDSIKTTLSEWNDFLKTPEGQQAVKDFFADIKATVQAIVDLMKTAYQIADDLGLLPEPEPTGQKPPEQAPEDRTGPDGGGLNGFDETPSNPPILSPQGSDGAGLDGFNETRPRLPTEIDPSRTKKNFWMGDEYYNYDGERVDKHGNKLDHTGGFFPGVKEGSLGDKILDSPLTRSATGLGGLWQWLAEDDDEANAKITGLSENFQGLATSAETNSNSAGTSWLNFGTKLHGIISGLTGSGGALPTLSTGQKQVALDSDEHVDQEAGASWASMGSKVKTVVETLVGSTVLGNLTSSFTGLPSFFDGITGGIGTSWGTLPGKLQGPINAVIDILNTFGELWNKVASKLGLPTWDPIDKVGTGTGDFFAGRPTRPEPGGHVGGRWMGGPGGPVKGPGGPKDDKAGLYRLSNGEHVWTADEVKAAGGHEAMYKMRGAVLQGGGLQSKPQGDGPQGYADGGGVVQTSDPLDPIQAQLWDLVRTAIPDAVLTSGKRFTDVGSGYDLHMQGKAIDLGGPMQEIARWIYNTYPQSAELIHWPLNGWQNLDEGQPHDFGATTNAQHMDHVHWGANDFLGNLSDEEKASIFSRIGSVLGGAVRSGRNALANTLLLNPLRNVANSVPDIEGLGEAGKIPKAFAQKMVEALATKVLGSGSSGGGGANYNPTDGVEQWRDLAMEAMRREGFNADDPAQVNAMMAQIQSESGGNPSIIQQVQDVNSGGNEAQGLLQIIPGTFAAHRDPSLPNDRTDPLANMVAALRYYRSRYGNDLTTDWGKGHGYDQGGIFENNTFGWNTSGLPEAVLTNPQWLMFRQFIDNMQAQKAGVAENPQAQTIPEPLNTDTVTSPTPSTTPTTSDSGVETFEQVGVNAQSRFTSALSTGFEDLVSSTLDPLGLPDPRDLIPSAVTDYGETLSTWQQARSASTQASQTLAQSGYQAASVPATGTANRVLKGNGESGSLTTIDNSTTINLTTPNVDEAYRKAELIRDMRALQHTATARG